MYNNINARKVQNTDEYNLEYEEIIGIGENGVPQTKEWRNYQTYLLSDEGRTADEIPLFTDIIALESPQSTNREGVYFTLSDAADNFTITEVVRTVPKTVVPGGVKTAAKKAAPVEEEDDESFVVGEEAPAPIEKAANSKFVLDGKTKNIFVSPSGTKIAFTASRDLLAKGDIDKGIKILQGEDLAKAEKAILAKGIKKEAIGRTLKIPIANLLNVPRKSAAAVEEEESFTIPDEEEADDDSFEIEEEETTPVKTTTKGPAVKSSAIKAALLEDEDGDLREILENEIKTFKSENWKKLEQWLKANVPNVPVYRVKNVIKATGGRKAWGMYKNGAIYVYTNAEAGTAYHEVFHAIWNMFSDPKERKAIVNEFKNRKGSFTDRVTGQEVKYSEATPGQIKEQLAEEFREYVLDKKIPPKPTDGRPYIVKMFADLVNFIKEYFLGPQAARNTEELFKRIGEGYYKNASPYQSKLLLAKPGIIDIDDVAGDPTSEYSLIANGLTGEQIHDTIQQMTYATLTNLIATNQSLFDIPSKSRAVIYKDAKDNLKYTVIDKVRKMAAKMVKEGLATQDEVARQV
jgi:hypothetical protein